MDSETYENMPLAFQNLKIRIDTNRGKYSGCYVIDEETEELIITFLTEKPDYDFLCASKYAIEFAENQAWDNSVFVFPQKHPRYVLVDDDIYGKLIRENTAEDLAAV